MDIINEITKLMQQQTDDDGYMRAADIAAGLRLSSKTTLIYLHKLHRDGRLDIKSIQVRNITGRVVTVPAYRVKTDGQNSENEH